MLRPQPGLFSDGGGKWISQEIYHLVIVTCSVGDRAKLEHACHKVCSVYSKLVWKAC